MSGDDSVHDHSGARGYPGVCIAANSGITYRGPRREYTGCPMNRLVTPFSVVGLFAAILIFLEIGRQIGRRRKETAGSPFGAMENAVFGLMGLLIAFTFSGAASRLDARRWLIAEETNAIGTAYLRIDLLPSARQEALRESFRRYLDARLAFYSRLGDPTAARAEMSRFTALQQEIWSMAIKACQEAPSPLITNLVVPSLNTVFDIATTRAVALQIHPPPIIFVLLGVLPLICSLLAGFDAAHKSRSLIHMLGFAAILAITVYVILDYEYPRFGLIREDAMDRVLVELRQGMH